MTRLEQSLGLREDEHGTTWLEQSLGLREDEHGTTRYTIRSTTTTPSQTARGGKDHTHVFSPSHRQSLWMDRTTAEDQRGAELKYFFFLGGGERRKEAKL